VWCSTQSVNFSLEHSKRKVLLQQYRGGL